MPHVKQHSPNPQQVNITPSTHDDRLKRFVCEISPEQIRKDLDLRTRTAQVTRAQALFAGSMW